MKIWHEMRRFPFAIRLLLINQLGVNTGFYLLIPYLAVHLGEDLGMSAAVVGIVLGVRNLSQQGLFLIGGSAADRLGARGSSSPAARCGPSASGSSRSATA